MGLSPCVRGSLDILDRALTLARLSRAAMAYLWFVTIYPCDDGNGLIVRALTATVLARSDGAEIHH